MTPTKGTLAICIKCNRLAKMCARGLCNACYDKDVKARKIRKCDKCGEIKPHHSGGLCYRCAAKRDYYKDHEKNKQYNRAKYHEHHARNIAKDRARNKTDKRRTWQQKHNQEQYTKNREKLLEYQRKYRVSHPGFSTPHVEKYKAKKNNLPHDLTEQQWQDILKEHNHSCYYCGATDIVLHREHKIPVSRGGGYTASNIVPACPTCNMRKHSMTDTEFFEFLKKFPR